MSQFDTIALNVVRTLQGVFGETAIWTPQNGGTPLTVTVICTLVQGQIIVSDDHGQQSDRLLNIQVATADINAPSRGDTWTLSSGGRAGIWISTRIEKASPSRWLITARYQTHDQIAGKGAIEVRP